MIDEKTSDVLSRMLGSDKIPAEIEKAIVVAKSLKDKVSGGQPLGVDALAMICALKGVTQASPKASKDLLNRVEELEREKTVPELREMYEDIIGRKPHPRAKENGLAQAIAQAEVAK